MTKGEIFDPGYVGAEQATASASATAATKSSLKEFLGESKSEEREKEMSEKYGSSKPKRVVIKAKLSNG